MVGSDEDEDVSVRPTDALTHGLRTTYVKGCRCEACRKANREYQQVYMAKWRKELRT